MRNRSTLIASMLLRRGDVDAILGGTSGAFAEHLNYVRQVIGLREGVRTLGTMNMVILGGRPLFMCDTYVNFDPSSEQLAELTARCRGGSALWARAQRRLAFAFELRQCRLALRRQDARSAGAHSVAGARSRGRRRDARR